MRRTNGTGFDLEVDARGLYCPLPLLRLAKSFNNRPAGTISRLLATDPAALEDVKEFCRQGSHRLIDSQRVGETFLFLVEKGS